MARRGNSSSSSKKKKKITAKSDRKRETPPRKSKPTYLTCPATGDKVCVRQATLSNIAVALKTKNQPFSDSRRKCLVTVPSAATRLAAYRAAAYALEDLETKLLPTYGGRPWKVVVKVQDDSRHPLKTLFRFYKGKLEPAVWPHLVEKIPAPPKFPGQHGGGSSSSSRNRKRKSASNGSDEDESSDDGGQSPSCCLDGAVDDDDNDCRWRDIYSLQERPVTQLSELAWSHRGEYPAPAVTVKWISPLHQVHRSRQSAWDCAAQLCRNELLIEKVVHGYSRCTGKLLSPGSRKCAVRDALAAGKLRFERDGLWVVGQEESWRVRRLQREGKLDDDLNWIDDDDDDDNDDDDDDEEEEDDDDHQEEKQQQQQEEEESGGDLEETKPPPPRRGDDDDGRDDGPEPKQGTQPKRNARRRASTRRRRGRRLTGLAYYLHCNREEYRDKRLGEKEEQQRQQGKGGAAAADDDAGADEGPSDEVLATATARPQQQQQQQQQHHCRVSFTLRDAEQELRNVWKTLDREERQSWIDRAAAVNDNDDDGDYCRQEDDHRDENDDDNNNNNTDRAVEEKGDEEVGEEERAGTDASPRCVMKEGSEALHGNSNDGDDDDNGNHNVANNNGNDDDDCQEDRHHPGHSRTKRELFPSQMAVNNDEDDNDDGQQQQQQHDDGKSTKHKDSNKKKNGSSRKKKKKRNNSRNSSSRNNKSRSKFVPSKRWRLNEEQIKLLYDAGMDHYQQIMWTVRQRDLVQELRDGFDLLRERGAGRYDMELPAFDTEAFSFLTDCRKAPWMPVVRACLNASNSSGGGGGSGSKDKKNNRHDSTENSDDDGDVVLIHKGMFLSMPGAAAQRYHQDGVHLTTQYQRPCHAVNVFVPLVNLTADVGPTEFCLGSHILGQEDYDRRFVETPCVAAGTPVVFDYRLGHKGLANSAAANTPRPIVYCTYAKRAAAGGAGTTNRDGSGGGAATPPAAAAGFRDSVNFSRKRYRKIGDLLSGNRPTRDERAKKRHRVAEERQQQRLREAGSASPSKEDEDSNNNTNGNRKQSGGKGGDREEGEETASAKEASEETDKDKDATTTTTTTTAAPRQKNKETTTSTGTETADVSCIATANGMPSSSSSSRDNSNSKSTSERTITMTLRNSSRRIKRYREF